MGLGGPSRFDHRGLFGPGTAEEAILTWKNISVIAAKETV
jgi:hypothetical protein